MNTSQLNEIVDVIVAAIKDRLMIPVEASGRHVHLSRKDIDLLFGPGYQLTKVKDLSQPGQYACKERVTITGTKGSMKNVVVLGPERKITQIEISATDATALGVKAPVRQSGELEATPGITISTDLAEITTPKGLIVAKRHIHITPKDADKFRVKDGDIVKVKVMGTRPVIFEDVVVRVSKEYATFMHIDYDESNACGFKNGNLGFIIQ